MLIFTLNHKAFKMLEFTSFQAIFDLIIKNRQKLFDDEYLKSDKPYIQRVYEIIEQHIPYFWLFVDDKASKIQGFCYFYDIVPAKNLIHTVTATICFEKSALGKPALNAAKRLIEHAFTVLRIYKIKAECYFDTPFISNFLSKLGFSLEATLKNEVIVDSKPKNLEIWSIFNSKPHF